VNRSLNSKYHHLLTSLFGKLKLNKGNFLEKIMSRLFQQLLFIKKVVICLLDMYLKTFWIWM